MHIDWTSLVLGVVLGVALYAILDEFVVPLYGRWLRIHDARRR